MSSQTPHSVRSVRHTEIAGCCAFRKLPTELISVIFQMTEGDLRFAFSLLNVCRRWHDIALATPMLWCRLDFEIGKSLDHIVRALERSGCLPLTIRIRVRTVERCACFAVYTFTSAPDKLNYN